MRFRHPDGSTVHLSYCTNVHPAETLDGVRAQLRDHCEPVRRRLGRDLLGIGLWLARDAARALINDPSRTPRTPRRTRRPGPRSGHPQRFPYEGFGAAEVKYRVYLPDLTVPDRLAHTTDLARLLAALLPDDVTEGTISTLPLAWRTPYDTDPGAARTARTALTTLAQRLDALAELHRQVDPDRPRTGTGLHRGDHRRRHRPAHRRRPRAHRHLRRHLPPGDLLRGAGDRARRPGRSGHPGRQVPALRRPARRTPPPARGPHRARRLRRNRAIPAPDPHAYGRRAARHRRPGRGRRRPGAPRRPRGAPTSTSPCTHRPRPRSPPRCPCSAPHSPGSSGDRCR
ncbi:hypothetical protein SMICM17S_01942 [Streptomyces microflavus]